MRYPPVTRRTFTARYVRSLVPAVQVVATPGGVGFSLDLGPLLSRMAMREALREAGVKPGSV